MNATVTTDIDAVVNAPAVAAAPSIAVPANATFSTDSVETPWAAPPITDAYTAIGTLVSDQEVWLNGVHRTANEQLYLLLQRCYHLYSLMASDKTQNKNLKDAIDRHNKERNLGIDEGSHTMTKIIKVVFGAERRRASAYALALRVALSERVEAKDIPMFFRNAGGVEEVRRSQSAKPSVDKVGIAKSIVTKTVLATVTEPEIVKQLDTGKLGHQVVLIATQGLNGSLEINSVVNTESAVKSALVAIYNAQSKAWTTVAADEAQASAAQQNADLMNRAIAETMPQTALAA